MPHSTKADRSPVASPTAAELGCPTSSVSAQTAACCGPGGCASTDANGNYTISGLPAGDYQVQFTAPSGSGLVERVLRQHHQLVDGDAGRCHARPGDERDRCLTRPGRIDQRSRHRQQRNRAAQRQRVRPNRRRVAGPWFASTDVNGNYTITGLPTGDYQVRFTAPSCSGLASEYYDNSATAEQATASQCRRRCRDQRDRCRTDVEWTTGRAGCTGRE